MTRESSPHVALVAEPINVPALLALVTDNGVGAVTLFLGTVRNLNDGRTVTGIDYEAYGAMAESELRAIAADLVGQMPELRLAIQHRVGTLVLGDVSVAIAAGHAHRAQALEASRTAIEAIKKRVPIWKREHYAEGDWQWVDPTQIASQAYSPASS
ncbi:MAG: molybdenum cofactor biosynthesis protein MoaE [Phycisphaerae bacterium]|nr:molybdenum cofactor biosynthesis protein MoaE [Gemmatimonadaceae bacterium]